jgi:hypothetical protein
MLPDSPRRIANPNSDLLNLDTFGKAKRYEGMAAVVKWSPFNLKNLKNLIPLPTHQIMSINNKPGFAGKN